MLIQYKGKLKRNHSKGKKELDLETEYFYAKSKRNLGNKERDMHTRKIKNNIVSGERK